MFRLLHLIYLFVFGLLFLNVIKRTLSGNLPPRFQNKRLRFLVDGIAVALLWPLALMTEKGRGVLRQRLP